MVGQALVTDEQVAQFQEDGAILLRGVLSSEWVDIVQKGIEANLASPSQYSERLAEKEGQGSYFNDYCNWQRIQEFRQFAFESPAAEIAAKMMRSSYAVFYHEHVLDKEPGAEKETPWHQDQPYYPVDGHSLVSLGMPVDPVSLDSAVKFVRGSHRWGRWFHPRKFATAKNYKVEMEVGGRKYEDVPLDEIEGGSHKIILGLRAWRRCRLPRSHSSWGKGELIGRDEQASGIDKVVWRRIDTCCQTLAGFSSNNRRTPSWRSDSLRHLATGMGNLALACTLSVYQHKFCMKAVYNLF